MTTNESLITEAHTFRATDNGAYLEIRLADALAASEAEVARVAQERDGLAAVIAAAIDAEDHMLDASFHQIVGKMIAILQQFTPTATLAARDAEKKAEVLDLVLDALARVESESFNGGLLPYGKTVDAVRALRTPQQGEPE
jgi:hypothetical protein